MIVTNEGKNAMPDSVINHLAFLPQDNPCNSLSSDEWYEYLSGIGMERALNTQKQVQPLISELNFEGIWLDYDKWSTSGVKPWITRLGEIYEQLAQNLKIGMYSVKFDSLIVSAARRQGIVIQSLSSGWLAKHRRDHIVINLLLEKRNLDRNVRSFVTQIRPQKGARLVKLMGHWNSYSSYTGRFTARDLPMAALPKAMRNYYVAPQIEGKPGCYLSLDANQIELRLLAGESNCQRLLKQFEAGNDVHLYFTSKLLGIPENRVTTPMRKMGKTLIYALIYGAGENRLNKIILKSNFHAVVAPHDLLGQLYPELMNLILAYRHSKIIYYGLRPTKLEPRIGKDWMTNATKQNLPVQSATSLLTKQVLIGLQDKVHVVNVVHDELICLCKPSQASYVQRQVIKAFEHAARTLNYNLPINNIVSTQILGGK